MKFSIVPSQLFYNYPGLRTRRGEFVDGTESFHQQVRDYENNTGIFLEPGIIKLPSEPARSMCYRDNWLIFEFEILRGMIVAIPFTFDEVKPYISIEAFPYRRNNSIWYGKVHLVYDGPEDLGLLWRLTV